MTKSKYMEVNAHAVVTVTAGNLSSIIEGYSFNISSMLATLGVIDGDLAQIKSINVLIDAMTTAEISFAIQAYAIQSSGSITLNAQSTQHNPYSVIDVALSDAKFSSTPLGVVIGSKRFDDFQGIWINTLRKKYAMPAQMIKAINERLRTGETTSMDVFSIQLVALAQGACSYGGTSTTEIVYTTKRNIQKFR